MLLTALLCSSYSGSRGVQIHSHNDYQKNIPFYRAYSQQVNTMGDISDLSYADVPVRRSFWARLFG